MVEIEPAFGAESDGLQGDILAAKGIYREAIAHWTKSLVLSGQAEEAGRLQHAYAKGGYRGYLDGRLQALKESSQREYVDLLGFAELYTRRADRDLAFDWLERAYRDRSSWLNFVNTDPVYDPSALIPAIPTCCAE